MPYFDGIKVGDKVYMVGNLVGHTVTRLAKDGGFDTEGYAFTANGELLSMENLGQVAFWQPVKIEVPPKPERWEKKTMEASQSVSDCFYEDIRYMNSLPDKYRNIQISWEEKV